MAMEEGSSRLKIPQRSTMQTALLAQVPYRHPPPEQARNDFHITALDQAIQKNDREFVQKLLALGAHPHQAAANFRTLDPAMRHLLVFHERKRIFYAQNTFCDRSTSLDKQLQALQDPGSGEGQEILRQILLKQGSSVVAAWNKAASRGRRDILRALLLLLPEDTIRKELARTQPDGDLFNSPLQRALPAIKKKDRGLTDVIKEFPYQSDRHIKRGSWKDFNHRLQFISSTSDRSRPKAEWNDEWIGRNIACRHYATYLLEHMTDDPALKFDYRRFGHQDLITAKVGTDTEARYEKMRAEASEVHLIDNAKFGEFLVGQFKAMEVEVEGKAAKAMLLESSNHVMTLGLRIKKKEGKRSYVVKFFDPTVTTHGTRSRASLKTFESQSLSFYLMKEGRSLSYYPESRQDESYSEGISIAFVRQAKGEPKPESSSGAAGIEGRTLTSAPKGPLTATIIWHAMKSGFDGNLKQWKKQFANLTEAQRLKLLAKSKDLEALYMALQNGHGAAIRAYAEILKMVPESQRAALVTVERDDGGSGLFFALEKGHADAIRAYAEILKMVPESRRSALVEANRGDGMPGLDIALQNGHGAAIRAYAEILKMVPEKMIQESQRAGLLAFKNSDVIPEIYNILRKCSIDAVHAYIELVAMIPESQRPSWLRQLLNKDPREKMRMDTLAITAKATPATDEWLRQNDYEVVSNNGDRDHPSLILSLLQHSMGLYDENDQEQLRKLAGEVRWEYQNTLERKLADMLERAVFYYGPQVQEWGNLVRQKAHTPINWSGILAHFLGSNYQNAQNLVDLVEDLQKIESGRMLDILPGPGSNDRVVSDLVNVIKRLYGIPKTDLSPIIVWPHPAPAGLPALSADDKKPMDGETVRSLDQQHMIVYGRNGNPHFEAVKIAEYHAALNQPEDNSDSESVYEDALSELDQTELER